MTFLLRLCSTVGLWIFVVATIFWGNEYAFFAATLILCVFGLREYFLMLTTRNIPCLPKIGMIVSIAYLSIAFFTLHYRILEFDADIEVASIVGLIGILFLCQMITKSIDGRSLDAVTNTLFGFLYIPWLFLFLLKILYLLPKDDSGNITGQYYILFVVLVTKFSDMGAYVFGSLFGKHAFVPYISPKKTWEGVIGAIATAFVGAYWLKFLMPEKLSLIEFRSASLLALILGCVAIFGDLSESIIKRSVQAKDSSRLVPGIGGTLDLIDSILFAAPIMYFALKWFLIPR